MDLRAGQEDVSKEDPQTPGRRGGNGVDSTTKETPNPGVSSHDEEDSGGRVVCSRGINARTGTDNPCWR